MQSKPDLSPTLAAPASIRILLLGALGWPLLALAVSEEVLYEIEAIDKMKHIHTLSKRIARLALPQAIAAQAA